MWGAILHPSTFSHFGSFFWLLGPISIWPHIGMSWLFTHSYWFQKKVYCKSIPTVTSMRIWGRQSVKRFIQTEIYVTLIQLIMENVIHWFRHFSYCIPTISFKFKNPITNIIPKEIQMFTVGLHHLCFCPQLRLMDLAGLKASWQISHLALS